MISDVTTAVVPVTRPYVSRATLTKEPVPESETVVKSIFVLEAIPKPFVTVIRPDVPSIPRVTEVPSPVRT